MSTYFDSRGMAAFGRMLGDMYGVRVRCVPGAVPGTNGHTVTVPAIVARNEDEVDAAAGIVAHEIAHVYLGTPAKLADYARGFPENEQAIRAECYNVVTDYVDERVVAAQDMFGRMEALFQAAHLSILKRCIAKGTFNPPDAGGAPLYQQVLCLAGEVVRSTQPTLVRQARTAEHLQQQSCVLDAIFNILSILSPHGSRRVAQRHESVVRSVANNLYDLIEPLLPLPAPQSQQPEQSSNADGQPQDQPQGQGGAGEQQTDEQSSNAPASEGQSGESPGEQQPGGKSDQSSGQHDGDDAGSPQDSDGEQSSEYPPADDESDGEVNADTSDADGEPTESDGEGGEESAGNESGGESGEEHEGKGEPNSESASPDLQEQPGEPAPEPAPKPQQAPAESGLFDQAARDFFDDLSNRQPPQPGDDERPVTTNDIEKLLHGNGAGHGSGRRSLIQQEENFDRAFHARLAKVFRQVVTELVESSRADGIVGGYVSGTKLTNPVNIYTDGRALGRKEAEGERAAIALVIDVSGSMEGSLYKAAAAAAAFWESLRGSAADIECWAYSDDVYSIKTPELLRHLHGICGTGTDTALRVAREWIVNQTPDRKIIVIITDGGPSRPGYTESETRECTRRGISILGLCLGSKAMKDAIHATMPGSHAVAISTPESTARELQRVIRYSLRK